MQILIIRLSLFLFSCYYIYRQITHHMKTKKKACSTHKKISKKPVTSKLVVIFQKTLNTTKEKTHNTIEQTYEHHQPRVSAHSARNTLGKKNQKQKLEEGSLSPFSNQGGSVSPKFVKIYSPHAKEQKEKKKSKVKQSMVQQAQKKEEKKKVEAPKRQIKIKSKLTKEESNQVEYENLLILKMNQKKITERSQESEVSIKKVSKLNLNTDLMTDRPMKMHKVKNERIKQLKQKVYEKYRKQFPYFKKTQLQFFCSIVLIQRLWRQKKIKNFISEFISPRQSLDSHRRKDSQRQNMSMKLNNTACTTQQLTSQLVKKYHLTALNQLDSNDSVEKRQIVEKQMHSTQMHTEEKKVNLKDLELSAEMSPQKENKIVRFIECMRDISFMKGKNSAKMSRINVFNLRQSLSQKCLMQTFYQKVFKNSPTKRNNFQIFSSKKEEKNLERSIELINTIKNAQKQQLIVLDERFQTQFECQTEQQNGSQGIVFNIAANEQVCKAVTVAISCNTQQVFDATCLKNLNKVAQHVIGLLIHEFSEEFNDFSTRSVLKKKKKSILPGLKITQNSIKEYLSGLSNFMLQKYNTDVVRRFNLINPLSFLKIHHEYDEDQYIEDEQDQQINMPIVPNTLFYEYQLIYEQQKIIVKEQQKKYSNFLQGLIKINNLSFANCFSQILQKNRIDRVSLPWDNKSVFQNMSHNPLNSAGLQKQLNKIIDDICAISFLKIGQFHKSINNFQEEKKMLMAINQQFKSQGSQWSFQYEYLQLRLQITNYIEETLMAELYCDLNNLL